MIAFDLEHSGAMKGQQDFVIEIAIYIPAANVVYSWLVKPSPGTQILKQAYNKHHITLGMLQNAPTIDIMMQKLAAVLPPANNYLFVTTSR